RFGQHALEVILVHPLWCCYLAAVEGKKPAGFLPHLGPESRFRLVLLPRKLAGPALKGRNAAEAIRIVGVLLPKGCSIVMLTVPTKSLHVIMCMEVCILETDSMVLTNCMRGVSMAASSLQSLISDIEYYLYPPDWSTSPSHVYRDANHSTDFLAKSSLQTTN
ncbi:hypothetical protein L195_g037234, partial [Trifolium pratense]